MNKPITELDTVVIRFAGDSGDGMQVMGIQFTNTSAVIGNDVHTFADFPAEIRAPAGTLPGVSGFQLSFSNSELHTSGDRLDVLVALNPAGLKVNLQDLKPGGILLVNQDAFSDKDISKAGFTENPLTSGELANYRVFAFPMTDLTLKAVKEVDLSHSQAMKCKNMLALGIVFWLYNRPITHTLRWLEQRFKDKPNLATANILALKAGYNFALTTEVFTEHYAVKQAELPPGQYRQINGNEALSLGCVAVTQKANLPFLLASYPITPASAILHQMAKYSYLGIKTFQAEDEIAAICACIGAAFGGSLALTTTSGPGFDLISEGLGLAVMTELPVVVVDVQRAGPSTGMPTKTEQADLFAARFGRHGECPIPIIAPATPSENFHMIIEAFHIALKYMTPVIMLSDGYLATSSEPWRIPNVEDLPALTVHFHTDSHNFSPYLRNPETLARVWALPGTPGLEHRLGGLEKDSVTGNISYDPDNHQKMIQIRADKVLGIAKDLPPLEIKGETSGKILVVGWGSSYGSILAAVERLQAEGVAVSALALRYLYPFQVELGKLLKQFTYVLVPELNRGQLATLLRAEYLIDVISYHKVTGKPFLVDELIQQIHNLL